MTEDKKRYLGAIVDLVENDPAFAAGTAVVRLVGEVARGLKRLREQAALSQKQMGARLGVSQGRISQIESGLLDHAPNLETIARYAHALGGTVSLVQSASGETAAPKENQARVAQRKRLGSQRWAR